MQQYGIADVFALARKASLLFVGIGQIHAEGFLVSSGMIRPDEVVELKREGACADLLGHFFNADGEMLDIDLSARATSMSCSVWSGSNLTRKRMKSPRLMCSSRTVVSA